MEIYKRNHCFEVTETSGLLVYNVDQGEPVSIKFTSTLSIRVLIEATDIPKVNSPDSIVTPPTPVYVAYGDDNQVQIAEVEKHNLVDPLQNSPIGRCKRDTSLGNSDIKVKAESNSSKINVTSQNSENFKKISKSQKCKRFKKKFEKFLECSPHNLNTRLRNFKEINNKTDIEKELKMVKRKIHIKANLSVQKNNMSNIINDNINISEDKIQENTKKMVDEKAVKCEYCELEFKNQLEFYNHRRAEESEHKCSVCGKVEPFEAHLIVHMQKHKQFQSDSFDQMLETPKLVKDSKAVSDKKTNKKVKMKCSICSLVLSSMDSLKIHTMNHTAEYAYKCCVCEEKFSSLSSREHHMDTHVSVQRFKCNPCDQRFTSRAELAKHQLTHEVKCGLCGQVFPNKTSRTCHYRISHPQDILKCTICFKLFGSEEDLNSHMMYHKKGKKDQCPKCGLVVSKLKDHLLLHSHQPQERMFVCDQCPMSYLRKTNLERHMRLHTGEKPYACSICPKHFRSHGMLRKHLLTHTQERPYQCDICGKRCSLRSNLNIHMRVHSSDKLFPCTMCTQSFNHKNSLHGHIKSKHSKEVHLIQSAAVPTSQQQSMNHYNADTEHPSRPAQQMLSPNLGSTVLLKPSNSLAQQNHHYDDLHLSYQTTLHNLQPSLLLDNDKLPLLRYEIYPQHT